ncbi:hypothetical protein DENIS_4083 [Desulfonema ishimotonii]|uniref:Uncharacterized protein n=1 Tax=Desulfonema ishimotonii TaxID=45657 RepID=A0A401G1K5_9BACT|nr:hypothetical protein DENIS_4083 [Desulfonema ishimotonii]
MGALFQMTPHLSRMGRIVQDIRRRTGAKDSGLYQRMVTASHGLSFVIWWSENRKILKKS